MKNMTIHQLVHGYDHGHEQLAGSYQLTQKDSDTVTRLSDLSGQLSQGIDIVPYITGYPLRTNSVYALAKTWPDQEASRAGCVVTHTLLIPSEVWRLCKSPHHFFSLFHVPNRGNLDQFKISIDSYEEHFNSSFDSSRFADNNTAEFVEKYFGEGIKPIVWMQVDDAESWICQILSRVWPALRYEISFCTYCLQPRYLGDEPFHFLFAPLNTYSRFRKIPKESIIGQATRVSDESLIKNEEPWYGRLSRALFFDIDGPVSNIPEYSCFSPLLGPDPTEIKKLYLLEALKLRFNESPTAIIGLLDIVEDLAPGADQVIDYKDQAIKKALDNYSDGPKSTETLYALAILSKRLTASPYASLSTKIESLFFETVRVSTRQYPEQALRALRDTEREIIDPKSPYVRAVAKGLVELADNALPNLEQYPDLAPHLISEIPKLAVKYLRSITGGQISNRNRLQSLTTWLERIDSEAQKQRLRVCLLPLLNAHSTEALLDQLLQGISEENVQECLTVVSDSLSDNLMSHYERSVISNISRVFPDEVRAWASHSVTLCPRLVRIVAGSYKKDANGLRELLDDPIIDGTKAANVLAAYLLSFADQIPAWVKKIMADDATILTRLLMSADSSIGLIADALKKVVHQITETPIIESPHLAPIISRLADSELGSRLVSIAMGSVIRGFISDRVDLSACRQWQKSEWGTNWLNSATLSDLWAPLSLDSLERSHRIRAWMWITQAPDALYSRRHPVLIDIVAQLRPIREDSNFEQQVSCWTDIIQRSSHAAPRKVFLKLCAHALVFAVKNSRLPVSPLVVAAYMPIYNAVTRSENYPKSINELFGFFDWDKGKELRKLVITAFMESTWPPGDLILSISDPLILQRVIQRASRRHGGEHYLKRAANELAERSDEEAQRLSTEVRRMLHERHNWDSWD